MQLLMRTGTSLLITGGIVLAAGAALSAQAPEPPVPTLTSNTPGAVVLQRILVKVNGELITQTDLEAAQVAAMRGRPMPRTDDELRRIIQQLTPQVITTLVDELLVVQRGRVMGYTLSDEQFDEVVDGIKVDNEFNDEQLIEGLAADGMTMASLRETLERQATIGYVQQVEVERRISMNDFEAQEYYEENIEDYIPAVTVTLREILIGVPEGAAAGSAADENARTRAEAVHALVVDGKDFATAAGEVSDAASKAAGGLIGPLELPDLADAVRTRLEGLEAGDITAVERTPAGYHMLQLASRTDPEPMPFEEVRAAIIDSVFASRLQGALEEYVAGLRDEAIIEWKDEALKNIYEQQVALRAARLGVVDASAAESR